MVTDWGGRFREKAREEALSLAWVVGGGRNRVSDVVAGTTRLLPTLYEGAYHEAMGAAPRPLARTRRASDGVVIWRVGGYRIGARSLRYCDGRYVQISPTFGRTCSVLLNGSRAP
jgi:hypothetical protein